MHPPIWELEHQVAEAIHKLGCVILAGRAAHLVLRALQERIAALAPAGCDVTKPADPDTPCAAR